MVSAAVLVIAMLPPPPGAGTDLWAGHQVVWGKRKIPVLGERETRTETFVLARVRRLGSDIELAQGACRVVVKDVAGVRTRIAAAAVRRLPVVWFRLEGNAVGDGWRGRWRSGWDARDWDGDGRPGLRVEVGAPLCGGSVYVATESESRAEAEPYGAAVRGRVSVTVYQRVLGASNVCLELAGRDTEEEQRGVFAYQPVPADSTCDSLAEAGWPVRAEPEGAR